MGILSMKWTEDEMRRELEPLLAPGEALLAGVYCTYQDYGIIFSSRRVIAGYAGLTDRSRLIGTRHGIFLHETFRIDLRYASVTVSELLVGSRHVTVTDPDARFGRQRFTFAVRDGGKKFPNHFEYAATLLTALQQFAH